MWIGDSGPDNWFVIYDVAGRPRQVETFGVKGGVWSEPSGKMGPRRFRNPVGIDFGDDGRIYVALGFAIRGQGSTHIECYEPDGSRLWQAYTHLYVGNAVLDPADGNETVLHTARAKWRADWSKPMGKEFTLERLTWQEGRLFDRGDSRYSAFHLPYQSVMIVTYGYGGWTRIYDARDGSYVGTLKPNTIASNRQGEVDSRHPMVAYQLSNGEYVIFVQSSGKHRVTVYRWTP